MKDGIRDNDAHECIEALARWDGEGGAGASPAHKRVCRSYGVRSTSKLNADLAKLHGRIMALENLVILLLADTTLRQRQMARSMAADILPRPESTRHPLTIHAAARMNALVERAERLDYGCV